MASGNSFYVSGLAMSVTYNVVMIGGIYELGAGNYYPAIGFVTTVFPQNSGTWFLNSGPAGIDIYTFGAATTLTNNVMTNVYSEIASGVTTVMCFMR